VLGSIRDVASLFDLGVRGTYDYLQAHPELAEAARVILGKRAVKYRLAVIERHIRDLPGSSSLPKPEQLTRGKTAKALRAPAPAAPWPPAGSVATEESATA